jgi:hypothetical protein
MTFNPNQLENMTSWCAACPELAEAREDASRTFLGEDDPRPVRYWEGAGEFTSKQRRFLGWFMFGFSLDDGRRPAEVAAEKLYAGRAQADALQAAQGARYVMAVVRSIIPGRGLLLEIEDERLEVRSRHLSRLLTRGSTLVSYLVPSRPGLWIPGPGWMEWPIRIGPNMRRGLKELQPDPISIERLLQMRSDDFEKSRDMEHPKDETLEQAVARMSAAARAEGRTGLILSPEEWRELVLKHLNDSDMNAFAQEIFNRVGDVKDVEGLNRWLALATNIWNTTPQPDRGGRTAREMSRERLDPP